MKLVIILILIVPALAHAQDLDSLKQRILALERTQDKIQLGLTKSHHEFRTGTVVLIAGIIVSSIELMKPSRGDSGQPRPKPMLGYIGLGMITVGGAIQIHSHRYIGEAGRKK